MKKVVLIDTDECGLKLTKGKIYSFIRICDKDGKYKTYEIVDDNGVLCYPLIERFIDIKKYRKEKLEKLNENFHNK